MKIFLLRCPKCKNTMKYGSKDCILINKRKVCVYCGHSFKVRENLTIKKELINALSAEDSEDIKFIANTTKKGFEDAKRLAKAMK